MSGREAARRLRVKYQTLMDRARKLNIGSYRRGYSRRREFSEADLDNLRNVLRSIPIPEGLVDIHDASRYLELSKTQVRFYAEQLGIQKRPPWMFYWFTPAELEKIQVAHEEGHERQQRGNRKRQHDAVMNDRDSYDYFGRVRAFNVGRALVQDPELSSKMEGGPQTETLQWHPFYVAEELDPDDCNTKKWGSVNEARQWISFEDLQQYDPRFMKDRY